MHIKDEDFQHNFNVYCLSLQVKFLYLKSFVEFFENLTESLVYFEAEETNSIESKDEDLWQIEAYLNEQSNLKLLQNEIAKIAEDLNIDTPKLKEEIIKNKDWVSAVQKTFTPINSGKFFIYNSHHTDALPEGKIGIKLDAGCAFGTGEHETTSNCLKALSSLAEQNYKFINSLDMGCGSGILAIAIAKLWPNQITAVDIDPQAINVARENFHINQVGFISAESSDGYNANIVKNNSSYQLITANILANPLIEMAKDAFNHLHSKGIIILAGFLNDQKNNVIKAYENNNFVLIEEIKEKDWPTLIMQKKL